MKRKRVYDIDDPRSSHHHGSRGGGRGRGHGHGHHHHYNYSRDRNNNNNNNNNPAPPSEPIDHEQERMSRIRQLLVRIGERSSSTLAHNLDQLSTALLVDIEHYRTFIISTLFECIVHLSIKIPIYATLVGLINHIKQDFGQEIVRTLTNEIILSLKLNNNNNNKSIIKQNTDSSNSNLDFNRIRLLLRFTVCLHNANIIEMSNILNIISILNKIIQNEDINVWIRQYICYILITVLIWCDNTSNCNEINTQIIDNFIQTNCVNNSNPYAFKPFKNIEINLLSDLWREYMDASGNNEKYKSMTRPYLEFQRLKKKYKHVMDFSEIEIDNFCDSFDNYRISKPLWIEFGIPMLLNAAEIDIGRNKYTIEEYIVSDYIHDIIEYFSDDPKLCSEQLINLQNICSFESKYIIVSGIMFKMFDLLISQGDENKHYIFFGKIIIELFRKQTKVWPRVIGPIVNIMFHNIENIDIECRFRFYEWFSFHLANFNFQWPWENWNTENIFSNEYKKLFISNVMSQCIHLSYYDRFKKTLPICSRESYNLRRTECNYLTEYKTSEICIGLLRMLNQRQSCDDIYNHLETHSLHENIEKQIRMLFVCILHVGKSSVSHVLSFLKLYGKKPLKELLLSGDQNENKNEILLQCLFEYWYNSPIRIEILCDKLHAMNYISIENIINYTFSVGVIENSLELMKEIYWIIIIQSFDRIIKTTQGMKRGINKFINDINLLNKNLNSDFNDQDTIITNKLNKEKQLNQLKNRLNNTNQKIENIFALFFNQSIKILYYLINKMENDNQNQNQNNQKEEEEETKDNQNDMEIDDDMLMSENWIEKQKKKEKENEEKIKNKKKKKINNNKYLFDIINQRMIEIPRRFYKNIKQNTWNIVINDIFKNVKNEKNNKYHQQIQNSIKAIIQIKQLLL